MGIPAEPDGIMLHGTTLDDYQACLRRTAALQRRLKPDLLVANTLDAFWAVELAQELEDSDYAKLMAEFGGAEAAETDEGDFLAGL